MSTKRQPKGIPVGGQFAANSHDEASSGLVSADGEFVSPRVTSTIKYEEWDARDNATETGSEEIDLSTVLDSYDLDDIPDADSYGDTDQFFYDAEVADLRTEEHGGPFTVDIDEEDLEAYIEARREAGKEEGFRTLPLHSTRERNRVLMEGYDRAFPRGGFLAIHHWKTDDDARAWANNAAESIDTQLDARLIERDRLSEEDRQIISDINSLRSGIGTTEGYLDRAKTIAASVGDRMIAKNRGDW